MRLMQRHSNLNLLKTPDKKEDSHPVARSHHGAHSDWVSHKEEGPDKNEEAGWFDC
jgi:hypothetical protein